MNKEELTIEQSFEELDRILEKLEGTDISLEESFAYYEKGISLIKACSGKIDRVEKKMMVLQGGENDGDA